MEKQIFVMRQKRRDPPIGMADGRLARDNPITANFLGMTAWDSRTGCDSFRRANHKAKSPGSPTDGMRRGPQCDNLYCYSAVSFSRVTLCPPPPPTPITS